MSVGQLTLDEPSAMSQPAVDTSVEQIVREHARFVFQVAYSVLRNREDAEDAAQETFLRLVRQRDVSEIREIKAWLARVTWRIAVDRVRKRPETSLNESPELLGRIADTGSTADDVLVERQLRAMLDSMIEKLPHELRDVVRLTTVQELSSADVGAVLGIPEGSVRQRLFRARQLLREKMLAVMEKKS